MISELLCYLNDNPEYLDRQPTAREVDILSAHPYHILIRPLIVRDLWAGNSIQQCANKYQLPFGQVRWIKDNFT